MRIDLETMNMNNEYDDLSVEKIWWYAKKVYLCLTFWFAEQIRKD